MRAFLAATLPALLLGCNPPATDEFQERGAPLAQRETRIAPIASPDTTNSVWATTEGTDDAPERIVFGDPGSPALLSLNCVERDGTAFIRLTRFNPVDRGAKALIAVIGNGHIGRWKVDATPRGKRHVWQGDIALDDPNLGVFDGPREVEATVPGGGSVRMQASPLTQRLIEACAARLEPEIPTLLPSPPADPA